MKKFFSILFVFCLGFFGLLTGCNEDRYGNLTITITTEQQRAEDGSITLYVGDDPEDITVTMGGIPSNFNVVPSFSMSENIVKLGDVNHMLDNGVRKTIEGIAPGYTVLTAYTSEGQKSTSLKINVIKKAESISANSDYKLAVIKRVGYTATIDTSSALTILPKDSNQNTIKYSLATEGLTDIISLRDNTLTVLAGITNTNLKEFQIKAEVVNHIGEVNENVEPTYFTVRILDDITQDDIKLYQSTQQEANLATLNSIASTLILSKNYVENNIVYVYVAVKTTETIGIDPPANNNSSPVMVNFVKKFNYSGYQYYEFKVQAIRYSGETSLNFDIYVDGYKDAYSFGTTIKVECQLYIKTFAINDVTLSDTGAGHKITLYTNEENSGAKLKIAVSNPREILASDARFSVALYNANTGEMVGYDKVSEYFSIKSTSNNSVLSEGWYLKEVTFSVKLQAGKLDVDDSGKYKLVITAERPLAYTTKATEEVSIEIVEGIKTINDISYGGGTYTNEPIKIKYEKNAEPLEVELNVTPSNITAYQTLYANSSNASVFRVEKVGDYSNKFKIYPLSTGEAEITFGSSNLKNTLTYKVSIYDDIEDFYVSVDDFYQSKYIGKTTVDGNNLKSAIVKVNDASSSSAEIDLKINTVPSTAKYYTVNYEVKRLDTDTKLEANGNYIQDDFFKLNTKDNSFIFTTYNADACYEVTIKLVNYDGTEITKTFELSAYVPITYINMTLTQDVLYNPNNLGYFDLNNASKSYTKTQATVSVNRDATYGYKENIFFEVVVDGAVNENILLRTDNLFELNKDYNISKYPQRVYITAYALEFGKRVEVTKQITIHDPVTVESMAVEGDINGDILYFKLGVDNTKDIKVTVNPSINLFNSNVKWVEYAEGTTTVLDFADNGSGLMTSVNTENAIFSVVSNGNNRFSIVAQRAGNARLLLIPEDKIKSIDGSKYVYSWDKVIELFVQVADGSKENPYHVSSLQDFKAIQNAMDKYYVLTSNIVAEDNWIPLGLETATPLTGGIKGLYTRILDAEKGTKYSAQYEISNLSYATAMPSSQQYLGLIYCLGDVEHMDAELDYMIVKYTYIQAEFSSNLTFGGLTAISYGNILNSKVELNNIQITTSGLTTDFGGLVGKSYGNIDNSEVDNSVKITATVTINNQSPSHTLLGLNIGGFAGTVVNGTINGYQKDYTETYANTINFGDQGYDVIANIKLISSTTFAESLKDFISIGGVVGNISNTNTTVVNVKDLAVSGSITSEFANNVGGIVGKINGVKYKDRSNEFIAVELFNNTNNARLTAFNNVGGVVGYATNANISYCSAENYRDSQTTKRLFIKGNSYVGGFAGYVVSCNIDHSFFVTYFENEASFNSEKISDTNSDIVVIGDSGYAGGFIGYAELSDDNVISSTAFIGNIYTTSADLSYMSGFVGWYNGSGSVEDVVSRGWGVQGMSSTRGISSATIAGTYYSTFNSTHSYTSIDEVLDKRGSFTDENIWKIDADVNDGLPYLVDGKGNILFAFLPISIDVEIIKNGEGLTEGKEESIRNDGYVSINDPDNKKVVVLYLNELKSGALTAEQLLALNTYKITSFANVSINPLTIKTLRLTITSNNSTVVKVDSDSLIVLKEGYARITISSKLNASYKDEFIVVVKYGFNDYSLYESSNMTQDTIVKDNIDEPIKIIVNKVKALYEDASYDRNVNGQEYSLRTASDVYVKYILESDNYVDSFIINTNWQRSGENPYTEVQVNTLTSIFAKSVLKKVVDGKEVNIGPMKVTAVPFINYNYFGTSYTYEYDYLTYSFYVEIFNGASNISFESNSTNVEITQLQSFVFGVIMDTDTIEDEIRYYVEYNGEIVDLDASTEDSMINLTKNAVKNETIFDDDENVVGKYSKYTVSFESTDEIIKEDKVFKITYYSVLVPTINASITITVVPQNIVSADIGLYSNKEDYNKNKDGTETFIFNDQVALLTVEIYPDFSKFDRYDLVYTSSNGSSLSINQLKYNKNATETDDPFSDYKDAGSEYVLGYGMKVSKASGAEPLLGSDSGIYSYSKIYYFSLLVGTNVPDLTKYTVSLVFYSDNKVVEPMNISYTFNSLAAPTLSIKVKDESLDNRLPLGTKNELSVQASNFTGEIVWDVNIAGGTNCAIDKKDAYCGECSMCLNENYALKESLMPTMDSDGKYYLSIPADNFNLIGKKVIITGTISKSENNETFTKTVSLEVEVTLFTVKGMGVEGLSLDTLKLPIYTPYSLKVTLDVVYSEDVKYEDYNKNVYGYTIANLVAKLREQISTSHVWNLVKDTNAEGESGLLLLEKDKGTLYNAVFECITYGDYYALYGSTVDIISTLRVIAKVYYENGVPTFFNNEGAEEPDSLKTYSKQFSCIFTYQNDIKNPIPISSQEEFEAMEEGKDYRLIKDILLENYTPIDTRILSLDGNGYTIYVKSFAEGLTATNYGLFGTLQGADSSQEATMIYNTKVYYLFNTTVTETEADGGNIVESYIIPSIKTQVELDVTANQAYNFGGIAGVNNGIVTNCEVGGLLLINVDNDILTESYVGGLVGVNSGFITNSKVKDLTINAGGNIGGVAGINNKTISSTFTDELEINNYSTNTQLFYTGGFVCENSENAQILECYVQGRRNESDVTFVNTYNSLITSGTAGGFAYKNAGSITDCYSNICINASAYSAGFIFLNEEEGSIDKCYSISRVAFYSRAASPFTGIGKSGGVTVSYEGSITNCYYLADKYNVFSNEPAKELQQSQFNSSASFEQFNFKYNTSDATEAEGYTWYISGGKPRLAQTDKETNSKYEYVGKSKNYVSNSETYFRYKQDEHKWYAYSAQNGYDTSKEMVISRRAKLMYYERTDGSSILRYYFKYVYDDSGNQRYFINNGVSFPLLSCDDPTLSGCTYYLSSDGNKLINYERTTGDKVDIDNFGYDYFDEVYTEDYGNIQVGASGEESSLWKNITTDQVRYYIQEGNGLGYLTSGSEIATDRFGYVLSIDVISVLYKDGDSSSLVDLSVDDGGQCDFTYIPTTEELGYTISNFNTAPYENRVYGGGYSYRKLDSVIYKYGAKITLGSIENPYLIYDTTSYNVYFKDKFSTRLGTGYNQDNIREYYRFVADIDFSFKQIATSNRTLYGYVEGNGMTIQNITLTYVSGDEEAVAFGLFAQSFDSIVNNLNLEIIEVASSAHTYVGGLFGWARTDVTGIDGSDYQEENDAYLDGHIIRDYSSLPTRLKRNYFNNITVSKIDDSSLSNAGLVLGRNFVGGLVGYVTGETRINNITANININSVYVQDTTSNGKYITYQEVKTSRTLSRIKSIFKTDTSVSSLDAKGMTQYLNRRLSYAGGIIGVLASEIVDEADKKNSETANVSGLTVKGEFTGAGFNIGGVIGLVARNNIAYNINVVVTSNQSIRGTLYAGGLVGENRGKITSSTIAYATDAENEIVLVTGARANTTFFNNNVYTTAIGGLVGFNNGGEIRDSISHVDVRNPLATVAGGAVGRSIMGTYNSVIVSGSVRAKSIMGGFVGTVNSVYMYVSNDGLGESGQSALAAFDDDDSEAEVSGAYPYDGSFTSGWTNSCTADSYTSCIAANNWLLEDYPYLTEKQNIKRVAGGFIGSEALTDDYFVNLDNLDVDIDNIKTDTTKIYSKFSSSIYTYSLYYGSTGENVAPASYMPLAYISKFDEVRLFTSNYDSGSTNYGLYAYMYPYLAVNTVKSGRNSIIGMTHYEIAYGLEAEYSGDKVEWTDGSTTAYVNSGVSDADLKDDNYFLNRIKRTYGAKSYATKNMTVNGTTCFRYGYVVTENVTNGAGVTLIVERDDANNVKSKKITVVEKYMVYNKFLSNTAFAIDTSTFYNKQASDNVSIYPKVKINTIGLSWSNYAGTEFSKDEEGNFLIESATDLATLASVVNSKATYTEGGTSKYYNVASYKLTTDIDISGKSWTPIGKDSSNPFKGKFDGQGHTISGVDAEVADGFAGVFGYIYNATIEKLTCEGGTVSGKYAGGIVGQVAGSSSISNCVNSNTVSGESWAGGIAGGVSGSLTNVYNKGKIILTESSSSNSGYVGGISGWLSTTATLSYTEVLDSTKVVNSGDIEVTNNATSYTASTAIKISLFIGGMVGQFKGTKFEVKDGNFVYNDGNISVDTNAHVVYVGGAFGRFASSSKVSRIRNNGDINVSSSNIFNTSSNSAYYAPRLDSNGSYTTEADNAIAYVGIGGVIGSYYGSASEAVNRSISLLTNNGSIYFDNQKASKCIGGIGGIVGGIDSTSTSISESYNTGSVEARVNAGVNINLGVGGILGLALKVHQAAADLSTITNCYNMGEISSSGSGGVWSGGIFGIGGEVITLNSKDAYRFGAEEEIIETNSPTKASVSTIVNISTCYNIGSVTGASTNTYGIGALLGYGVGATANSYNYYLVGSANYAYASFTKAVDSDTQEETISGNITTISNGKCEQRTTNTLKIFDSEHNIGVNLADTAWAQEVITWYPTLKNNYEVLYWKDSFNSMSVEGTSFTISNADQLSYLSYAVNNGLLDTYNVKFVLKDNIDMSNRYFTPIGTSSYPFKGEFDGNGYSIKNITINASSALTINIKKEGSSDIIQETVGSLFGYVEGGKIKNVGLVSPIISGVDYASGFAYSMREGSEIQYCYLDSYEITDPNVVAGNTDKYKKGNISGYKLVAGFVNILDSSNISCSYNNVDVAVIKKENTKGYLTGIANYANSSQIENCYIGSGVGNSTGIFTYQTVENISYTGGSTSIQEFTPFINFENGTGVYQNGQLVGTFGNEEQTTVSHSFNLSTVVNYVSGVNTGSTSMSKGTSVDITSTGLKDAGWDVVSVWSYEYSLLGSVAENNPPTIRGLGQNWYNTECIDLVLKNVVGVDITDRANAGSNGSEQNFIYYEINTAEELAWIARMVNTGKLASKDSNGNRYIVKLMNDIDLSGRTWTPIGTMDHPFGCKFDFNGYNISNLVIDTTNINFAGLFGYTNDSYIVGGTITNEYINVDFTDEDANNLASIKTLYVGGIVGKGHNTQIENMKVEANIVGYSKYNSYVGGIAGSLTYGKTTESQGLVSAVKNVEFYVKDATGVDDQVLIPDEYRLNNGFGLDEVLTEANRSEAIQVNIGGFSLAGNSYVGGIVGYISGKYTKTYQTQAEIKNAKNNANVVSYSNSDISRTYAGGIAGYVTENSLLNAVENVGSLKTATYGFDYIGGIAGMIDGASELDNVYNKGKTECSQFASVLSYSGGIGGYLRGGSTVTYSVNFGTAYKNVDSTKIFSAGVFGYVEKDVTGTMPTVKCTVYSDDNECYTFDEDSIGYYGDGELPNVVGDDNNANAKFAIKCVSTLLSSELTGVFDDSIWNIGDGTPGAVSVYKNTLFTLEYDSTVAVYYVSGGSYAGISSGSQVAIGTEIVIVIKGTVGSKNIILKCDGVARAFEPSKAFSFSGSTITSNDTDGATKNAIVVKVGANGLTGITAS